MQIREDWRIVLRRAWSVRLILLAGLLTGIEAALPLLDGYVDMPRGVFAALSGITTCAALVARVTAQRDLS